MAHLTSRTAYQQLVERLNRFPLGAPPSELLYRILEMLFNEREAELVAALPIKPFNADKAARTWKMPQARAQAILDELASRTILLDVERDGQRTYVLPPPMAGFFEFSMMRIRDGLDQKVLGELLYQYLNVEDEFITALFADGETHLGRTFVAEPALGPELSLQVLDHERARWVIESARCIGVGVCYCRHKMLHMDRACEAPLDICVTFNGVAASLTRHGYARQVEAAECLDLLEQAMEKRLVQFGENVRQDVSFICNCCGCCPRCH